MSDDAQTRRRFQVFQKKIDKRTAMYVNTNEKTYANLNVYGRNSHIEYFFESKPKLKPST